MFNWSEVHLYRVTCYKIHILAALVILVIIVKGVCPLLLPLVSLLLEMGNLKSVFYILKKNRSLLIFVHNISGPLFATMQ